MKIDLQHIGHKLGNNTFQYHSCIQAPITAIYGPSGAGKTTLLNIISGLEAPTTGTVLFDDEVMYDAIKGINVPESKRHIGVVFQDNYLFPHLSVKQNLTYSKPYISKRKQFIDFNQVIDLLDIKDLLDKKPGKLSGGERQRVAIGRALLSQPRLLLLDEPFSSLDVQRRQQIISYLLKINNQFSLPLLIISHDMEDILKLTREIIIVKEGKIVDQGNYLDIVVGGKAAEILPPRSYLNVFDAVFAGYDSNDSLAGFLTGEHYTDHLQTSSDLLQNNLIPGQRVRLCIRPDDIALSIQKVTEISIQNQLRGKVLEILQRGTSFFVKVDCGTELIAEVTQNAIRSLDLDINKEITCLIKAKSIEVVHTYHFEQLNK